MKSNFREQLGAMLPESIVFPHFPEREAAWLLHHRLEGPARIGDLRRSRAAPLLTRPGVREILASCGDGRVKPRQLLPLAEPLHAFGREHELMVDRPSETAFDLAASAEWQMFTLTFTSWAEDQTDGAWRDLQVSRPGGNLVLQLNFPESYRVAFDRLFPDKRDWIDYYCHPVRHEGPITMAWARLDFEPWGEDVLIEELQTDWLRELPAERKWLVRGERGHERAEFIDATTKRFGRVWSRILMLAVLIFATRELGARRVWLHRPETGAKLKNIRDELPPRSVYTDLPKRFGFAETHDVPDFLARARGKAIAHIRRTGQPMFWMLDLGSETATTAAPTRH